MLQLKKTHLISFLSFMTENIIEIKLKLKMMLLNEYRVSNEIPFKFCFLFDDVKTFLDLH